jgi:polyhydroxybutyrate depolymerase
MLSQQDTLRYWSMVNGCDTTPQLTSLPDAADDGTVIRQFTAMGCNGNADVVLDVVRGGGHTWPGHAMQAPIDLGVTSQDIDATTLMWDFFKAHPRQA